MDIRPSSSSIIELGCSSQTSQRRQFPVGLSAMAKLLLVEDDLSLATNVKRWLEFESYLVEHTGSGADGLNLMKAFSYDVVILDVNLPHMNGFDVCQEYRSTGGQSAILMLTTKAGIEDKEQGFGAGADDYLAKPFNLKELSLRVKGLLKRARTIKDEVLRCRGVVMNPTARTVEVDGVQVDLPNLEFSILELLLRNKGKVLSTDAIIERTSKSDSERTIDSLRTALKKLRRRIDKDADNSMISNIHGVGYKISD